MSVLDQIPRQLLLTFHHLIADPLDLIAVIHGKKMKAGVAISPDTPSTAITDEVAAAADMLLVMTVYPGSSLLITGSTHPLNSMQRQAEVVKNSWIDVYQR